MIDALAETHDDRLRYRGQTFDCRLVFFPFFFSLFFSFLFFLPFFSLKFYPRTECMLDKRFEINFQILIQHAKILISYYFISFLLRWIYLYLNSLNEFTSRDIFFFFFCTISQRWFSYFGWRMYYWEAYIILAGSKTRSRGLTRSGVTCIRDLWFFVQSFVRRLSFLSRSHYSLNNLYIAFPVWAIDLPTVFPSLDLHLNALKYYTWKGIVLSSPPCSTKHYISGKI